MPPEAFRNDVSAKWDVWSFGVVSTFMLHKPNFKVIGILFEILVITQSHETFNIILILGTLGNTYKFACY